MIRLIGVFLFLVVYFIISLPIQLAELIIQKFNMDIRNKSSLSFVQWGLKCVMFISGVKLEVTGYENIPKDTYCYLSVDGTTNRICCKKGNKKSTIS